MKSKPLFLILNLIYYLAFTANAQNAPQLEQSDVYGDLSEYLSWPMSATAFSGTDLGVMNRFSDRDLADLIPNYSKTDTGIGSFGDVSSMRGLTNTPFFSSPSVIQYVDDVPSGNIFSHTTPLHAVDRVEILRGAQSTLFGVNSYAGVVNIVSKRPSNVLEGSITSSFANYDSKSFDSYIMGPLNDDNTLSFRLGGQYFERDGYLNNSLLGISPDNQEHRSGAGSIYWNLSDNWEISLSASYDNYDDGISRLTSLGSDPFTLNSDVRGSSQQDAQSQSLRMSYESDELNFLSVTSRRNWEISPYHFDLDFGPNPGNESKIYQEQDSISQEFRFSSNNNSTLEWTGGAYFGETELDGNTRRDFIIPIPPQFGGGFTPASTTTDYILSENSYALFGQITYNGIERTGMHFGLRLDQVEKGIYRNAFGLAGPVPLIDLENDYSFASPRAGIDFELNDTSLVYVNTGISSKPGGFSAFIDDPQSAVFDEEESWNNEIGLKKKWLDGNLKTNIALFHNEIDNYQVERSLVATDYAVLNAEEAESYGVEIEFSAEILDGLTLQGSLGTVNTELTKYTDPLTGADLSGNKAPFVPEIDASLSATYQHETGLFARVELVHKGEIFFDDRNVGAFVEDGFTVLNAAVGYKANSGLEVSLFGTNLTDEVFYLNMTPDLNAGTVGAPQLAGIKIKWDY
ncbi:TonB-dependent receptor [Verrucomicrobiales bacterium]|nr:TonB-dependent receptor [Verrucomicrobiales bacterium]MDB4737244.1 TonB-dependent receptor [Verrucomicrobiales bacterium]